LLGKQANLERLKKLELQLSALEGVVALEYTSSSSIPTITDISNPTLEESIGFVDFVNSQL
jgi:hypothetical protein